MKQLFISRKYLTLTGKKHEEKDVLEFKKMLAEKEILNKVSEIEINPEGNMVAKADFQQKDIEMIWEFYEKKDYLGRRVGDVQE